jgi:hypothetical protein
VHGELRGLVHDQQVLVLVDELQLHGLGPERRDTLDGLELHLLPTRETVALRPRLAVNAHVARGEQALRLGA